MDEKTAAQVEADRDETTTVDWSGVSIEVPARFEDIDLDAMDAFEKGKGVEFARRLVADFDAKRREFEKVNSRRPKAGDLRSFMDAVAVTWGFENQGN